jgi:hypothetical protein
MTKIRLTYIDRRREPRWRSNERATIWSGGTGRGCIVVDQSRNGARLKLGTDFPLPLRFELEFASSRFRRVGHKVWQSGETAAVQFDDAPSWGARMGRLALLARAIKAGKPVFSWRRPREAGS